MCIFCKLVSGELPSWKVYEDEKTLAFLDIKPIKLGHILVITKKHYQNLDDITPEDLNALMLTVKKMGAVLKEKLGVPGYNVCENNDPIAGQDIPHIHFHVVPREANDDLIPWPKMDYAPGGKEEMLARLTK